MKKIYWIIFVSLVLTDAQASSYSPIPGQTKQHDKCIKATAPLIESVQSTFLFTSVMMIHPYIYESDAYENVHFMSAIMAPGSDTKMATWIIQGDAIASANDAAEGISTAARIKEVSITTHGLLASQYCSENALIRSWLLFSNL